MISIPGFDIRNEIYEGGKSVIFKAQRKADKLPVIIKLLKKEYPTGSDLNRVRREFEMLGLLANAEGVINVYGLEEYGNSLFLVLEDIGGLSLKEYIGGISSRTI